MNKSKRSSKRSIVILVLILILVLPFLFAMVFGGWIESNVSSKITSSVYSGTDGRYLFRHAALEINYFPLQLKFEKPSISPIGTDTSQIYVSVKSETLVIDGFSLADVLFRNYINIDEVKFVNPELEIFSQIGKEDSILPDKHTNGFDSIIINTIKIVNAKVTVYNDKGDTLFMKSGGNDVEVEGFKIAAGKEGKNEFRTHSIYAVLHNLELPDRTQMYKNSIDAVYISLLDSTIKLEGIHVKPVLNKSEFNKKRRYQSDRIELDLDTFLFTRINLQTLIKYSTLNATELKVNGGRISAFRDKNYVRKNEVIPSLQKVLLDCPIKVSIIEGAFENINVTYEELAPGKVNSGVISVTELNGRFRNLYAGMSSNSTFTISSKAKLAKGSMTADWEFPLNKPVTSFKIKGSIVNLPLKSINTMVKPSAGVEILSGFVSKMDFYIDADHNYAKGNVNMLYKDLKIDMDLRNEFLSDVSSSAVNNLILYQDNPMSNQKERKGRILYAANPQRFIFNYSLKALLTGVEGIVVRREWD